MHGEKLKNFFDFKREVSTIAGIPIKEKGGHSIGMVRILYINVLKYPE